MIQGLPTCAVSLDGLGGSNTLSGPNVVATWQVQGTNQGMLTAGGTASFTSMQTLNGGSQDDRFVFANGQGVTGSVYGNGGTDTLDFSAYSAAFGVDLNLATGLTNRGASFVWFIENVMGGFGNDTLTGNYANNILVGGEGNDTLSGGDGRDLLIDGDGQDILNGGQHDDILIGGYTNHDQNLPALTAIMSEWTSTTLYNQRVDHLRGTLPGGKNGGAYLRAGTVWQDPQIDTFTGDLGDDWFWGQIPGEPNDRLLGERVN